MTDPLRVATVVTRLESGAGSMVLRGARSLDPNRFQVTIVTGSGGRMVAEAMEAGLEVVVEPLLRRPIRPRNDAQALAALTRFFMRRQVDVAHTHCAKAGALGRLAAHRAGVPRIVHTYHGLPFHPFQSAPVRQTYLRIERRLGACTDVALCVGDAVAAEVARRSLLPPDRIRAIGVAVDESTLTEGNPGRLRARALLGVPPEATVVGAVGRLTYQKAPEDLVAALRRLDRPEVVGVWVGDGELAGSVRRLAARGRPVRMVFAGERGDVPDLLPAFDIFALPSRYEGLPIALVEAMTAGLPVVATAVNAVPDVVVPGRTGLLVPPCRPECLAAAIDHLIRTPGNAARMAIAGQRSVSGRFTESRLADSLMGAYEPAARPTPAVDRPILPYGCGKPVR